MAEDVKTEVKAPTRAELETSIKKAASENRMDDLLALTEQLKALAVAERKAVSEARAKAAEGVNRRILEAVSPVLEKFDAEIVSVGGVCRIIRNVPDKLIDVSCGEKAAPKAAGKGSGTNAGKTSEQYGVSLGSIFEQYANAEERAAHDSLPPSENTKRWNIKKRVRDRAISEGLIKKVA